MKVGEELNNAQGDLAIVNGIAKMLDPESVIRPSEFTTVEEAQGFLQQFFNLPRKFMTGDRLTNEVRSQFLTAAERLFSEKTEPFNQLLDDVYRPLADDFGVNFDEVAREVMPLGGQQSDIAGKIDAAIREGHSPQKIIDFLKQDPQLSPKIDEAIRQGYSPQEVIDFLKKKMTSAGQAEKVAQAISAVESGGKQVKGKSGEFGIFQFLADTWKKISKEVAGKVLPQTPENEQHVATEKIRQLLSRGFSPEEVALIWNTSLGGEEKPFRRSGVNDKGVKFDSAAYAQKVLNELNKLS